MLSLLRSRVPRTPAAHLSKVFYEDAQSSQEFNPPDAQYFVSQVAPPSTTKSLILPPLHYHVAQEERFIIHGGSGRFILSGEEQILKKSDTITIPIGAYHSFENASADEPLVFSFQLDPYKPEMEICFFKNLFGYLDDCRKSKVEPSLFQILRFFWAGGVILSVAPGPSAVTSWLDWAFTFVGGVIVGELLLGYKASYVEYYRPKEV